MTNPAGPSVRHAKPEDIPAVLELEREIPELAHWSEQSYREAFEPAAPERIFLVAEIKSATQGFLIARFTSDLCELENIVVARVYRGRGIATQLLERLVAVARERRAEKVLLEVRESNSAARALYRKLGFRESGRRRSYYSNPAEDAIIYLLAPLPVQMIDENPVTKI